jgi:hypothetical protein
MCITPNASHISHQNCKETTLHQHPRTAASTAAGLMQHHITDFPGFPGIPWMSTTPDSPSGAGAVHLAVAV